MEKSASAEFELGVLTNHELLDDTTRRKGTKVSFIPDPSIFKNYKFRNEYVATHA